MTARPKLSKWFLVVALCALGISLVLAILILPKIDTDTMLPAAIVGYLLTPFAVAAVLIAARARDLRLQSNALYLRLDGRTLITRIGIVVALSFIPAFVFIWYIASYVGSVLS